MHGDHIKGLTPSWRQMIYTSPVNKALLQKRFQFPEGVVITLELDEPHIIPMNLEGTVTITVTLIDANHVPGAVMFLFQGYFGNILYCGDMRYSPSIIEHPSLQHILRSGKIDVLYLDNTFCHPNYNFPSRHQATEQLFKIIEEHPNHTIKLGIRTLGKEDLLEAVARRFQELVLVSSEKFEQLKILKRPAVYTTRHSESRIHAVLINTITARNHSTWNEEIPTVSIKLTALYYGIHSNSEYVCPSGLYTVPYSDHSSWEEIVQFVKILKPREIIPVVRHGNKQDPISRALYSRDDMSVFKSFLSSPSITPRNPCELTNFHGICEIPILRVEPGIKKIKLKKRRALPRKGVIFQSPKISADKDEGLLMLQSDLKQLDSKNSETKELSNGSSERVVPTCLPLLTHTDLCQELQNGGEEGKARSFPDGPKCPEAINIFYKSSPNANARWALLNQTVNETETLVSDLRSDSELPISSLLPRINKLSKSLELLKNAY